MTSETTSARMIFSAEAQLPRAKNRTRVQVELTCKNTAVTRIIGEWKIRVLLTGLAVDYNRDGEVCFGFKKKLLDDKPNYPDFSADEGSDKCNDTITYGTGNDQVNMTRGQADWLPSIRSKEQSKIADFSKNPLLVKQEVRPYWFWLNDNYDDLIDGFDSPLRDDGKEQYEAGYWSRFWGPSGPDDCSYTANSCPDFTFNHFNVERNLDDFTRMWIKRADLPEDEKDNLSYYLYFASRSGDPMIKIFEHAVTDNAQEFGSEKYLSSNKAAEELVSLSKRTRAALLAGKVKKLNTNDLKDAFDITGLIKKSPESDKPQFINASKNLAFFLFEGYRKGSGVLTLEIVDNTVNMTIAKHRIPVDLRTVSDYYEDYTLGDQNILLDIFTTGWDPTPPSSYPAYHPESEFKYNVISGSTPDDEKDYTLLVHGMNMNPENKRLFANTMFKRLWWQGYRGRFGLMRWPTNYGWDTFAGPTYHISEERSWNSGAGLKELLINLGDRGTLQAGEAEGGARVHLAAHSQGNPAAAEALRQLAKAGKQINTYVSIEAALHADAYAPPYQAAASTDPRDTACGVDPTSDPNAQTDNDICEDRVRQAPDDHDTYAFALKTNNLIKTTFGKKQSLLRNSANLYRYFPVVNADGRVTDWQPFLGTVKDAVKQRYNVYNPFDNLTGQPVKPLPGSKTANSRDPVTVGYRGGAWRVGQWTKFNSSAANSGYWLQYFTPLTYLPPNPKTNDRLSLFYGIDPLHTDQYYTTSGGAISPFIGDRDLYRILAYGVNGYLGTVGSTPGVYADSPHPGTYDEKTDTDMRARADLCIKPNGTDTYSNWETAARVYHSAPWYSYSGQRYRFWRGFLLDLSGGRIGNSVTNGSQPLDDLMKIIRKAPVGASYNPYDFPLKHCGQQRD